MNFKTALVVDDDNKFRALLKRLLEKKFHMIVFEADNGLKGLEVFQRETANIIFLDISMPYMDGIELLEKIRNENKDVPVIMLTCMCDKDSVSKILKLGVTDYLLKTEFVTHLSDRIESIVYKANFV